MPLQTELSLQSNLVEDGSPFPAKFWLLVALTGVGAGLGGSALMRLLYAVQHVAWSYEVGTVLAAIRRASTPHRFLVLTGAGLIAGVGQRLVRHSQKGHAGDLTEALAHRAGEMPAFNAPPTLLVWALVTGPLFGLASVGYIRVIAWADRFKPRRWLAVAAPVAVFAALGGIAAWFPEPLGNGKSLVQVVFSDQVATGLVPLLLGLKLLAIAGCLGSGAPGGLFTPTVTCGSLLGSCLGSLWTRWWPGAPPASFALLGAGAVIAAAMQGPVSAIVMVLELTHRLDAGMVPLMLAVTGASLTTRLLERRSIYTVRIAPSGPDAKQPTIEKLATAPIGEDVPDPPPTASGFPTPCKRPTRSGS